MKMIEYQGAQPTMGICTPEKSEAAVLLMGRSHLDFSNHGTSWDCFEPSKPSLNGVLCIWGWVKTNSTPVVHIKIAGIYGCE